MSVHKTYELGTAVKITTILSLPSPTSVKITIKNASNQKEIDAADMTQDTTTIFTYIYQSAVADDNGEYTVIIDVVSGALNSRAISRFTLVDNDL